MITSLVLVLILQLNSAQPSDPLLAACRTGNLELAQTLIQEGAPVNAQHKLTGWTPLITASFYGHTDVVKMLLAKGADPNISDRNGGAALLKAVSMPGGDEAPLIAGKVQILQLLLAAGADAQHKDRLGGTAWETALLAKRTEFVNVFADAGVRGVRESLLMEAIAARDSSAAEQWMARGVDLEYHDDAGWSPLGEAALAGDAGIVRKILELGADKDSRQERNWTPLMIAASRNNAPVVLMLLQAGADPSLKNDEEQTALDIARKSGYTEVVGILNGPRASSPPK